MRTLLLTLLLAGTARSESIRIVLGEGSCQHIAIKNLSGETLILTTRQEIVQSMRRADDPLMIQIKTHIKESGLSNIAQIKTLLEGKDFEINVQ